MSCQTVERDRCCCVEWICVLIDCVLADCLHAGRTCANCMLAALCWMYVCWLCHVWMIVSLIVDWSLCWQNSNTTPACQNLFLLEKNSISNELKLNIKLKKTQYQIEKDWDWDWLNETQSQSQYHPLVHPTNNKNRQELPCGCQPVPGGCQVVVGQRLSHCFSQTKFWWWVRYLHRAHLTYINVRHPKIPTYIFGCSVKGCPPSNPIAF